MHISISALDDLARTDPAVAPLATLRAEALRSVNERLWDASVPSFEGTNLERGQPLLHGVDLRVSAAAAQELLSRLAAVACVVAPEHASPAGRLPDALALMEASVRQDQVRMEELAAGGDVDPSYLGTLGQLLALPLLHNCGQKASQLLEGLDWNTGYCPVCGAWASIAEARGVELQRWLRCGRCGAEWRRPHMLCAFCGNDDYHALGYLAAQSSRESRQAATCERCRGYLKSVPTPTALDVVDLFIKDVGTIDLDVAAIDSGYHRPDAPGFALGVRIVPA